MTLSDGRDGQWLLVRETRGDEISMHAMRFGIGEGTKLQVQKNIPGGPVVVLKNHLEIAVGRLHADSIHVEPISFSKKGI